MPGGKPLPPFEQWAFARQHYAAYLADLHAVHAALEDSLAAAEGAEVEALAAAGDAAGDAVRHQQLLAALRLFGPSQGLARATALRQDLQRLAAQPQQEGQQEQQQQGGKVPPPTQHAAAYASYLASLARQRRAAEGPQEEERVSAPLVLASARQPARARPKPPSQPALPTRAAANQPLPGHPPRT